MRIRLSTDSSCQLDIFWYNGDMFAMDDSQVCILKVLLGKTQLPPVEQ